MVKVGRIGELQREAVEGAMDVALWEQDPDLSVRWYESLASVLGESGGMITSDNARSAIDALGSWSKRMDRRWRDAESRKERDKIRRLQREARSLTEWLGSQLRH